MNHHCLPPRGGLFRRTAVLLFLLALSALAACPAFADAATEVWVDGVNVADAGTQAPDGVSWDGSTSTLTLDGANLTQTYARESHESAISANGDLTILLKGDNTIAVSGGSAAFLDGIYANGVVAIEGDGSLAVTANGTANEVNGLATGYTDGDAGLVVNGGTVTLSASGSSVARGLYLDRSYGTSLPPRYLKVNGGTLTLAGSSLTGLSFASSVAPDVSGYPGSVISASYDVSGQPPATYTPFEPDSCYYLYLKIEPLVFDENGFAEGGHYQPATLAADDVYEVSSAGQLFWFSEKVAAGEANAALNARLTADITIPAGREWIPIAAGRSGSSYNGTFDGQGHAITGLTISSVSTMNVSSGLVKTLGTDGVVKNLTLRNFSIAPPNGSAGAVCGTNHGTIQDCFVEGGQISVTFMCGGGIAGENSGSILRCGSYATVSSVTGYYIGGIAGQNLSGGSIENCWNTGDVSGSWAVGGITGCANSGSSMANCFSTGSASASSGPGYEHGLAGFRYVLPENSYYLAAAETTDGGRTRAQFQSGEVAWLLNGGESPADPAVWGQTLSGGAAQGLPVLNGAPVYKGWAACWSDAQTFSNDPAAVHDQKPAHDFSVLRQDEATHWYACSGDGCTAISGSEAHHFDVYTSNGDSTCTADGTETAVCAECGASHTRVRAGSALGHTGGRATCNELAVCVRCGSAYGSYDADNHVGGRVTKNAAAATCTADGYTGDVFCADCGVILERGTVIPAGHQFQDGVCLACGARLAGPSGVNPPQTGASLPQTGDESSLSGWTLLLAASLVGFAVLFLTRRPADTEADSSDAGQ